MHSVPRNSPEADFCGIISLCLSTLSKLTVKCNEMSQKMGLIHQRLVESVKSEQIGQFAKKCITNRPYLLQLSLALSHMLTSLDDQAHHSRIAVFYKELHEMYKIIENTSQYDSIHDEMPVSFSVTEEPTTPAEVPDVETSVVQRESQDTLVNVKSSTVPWSKFKFSPEQQEVLSNSSSFFMNGDCLGANWNSKPYRLIALQRIYDAPTETSSIVIIHPEQVLGEAKIDGPFPAHLKGNLTEFKVLLKNSLSGGLSKNPTLHLVCVFRNLQQIWMQHFDVHQSSSQTDTGPDSGTSGELTSQQFKLVPSTSEVGTRVSTVVQFLQFGARPLRNSLVKLISNNQMEPLHLLVLRSKGELVFSNPHTLEIRKQPNKDSDKQPGEDLVLNVSTSEDGDSGTQSIFDFQAVEEPDNRKMVVAAIVNPQQLHAWRISSVVNSVTSTGPNIFLKVEARVVIQLSCLPNPMLEWSNCQLQFLGSSELALFWTQDDDLKVKRIKLDFSKSNSIIDTAHDKFFKMPEGLNGLKKNPRMFVFNHKEISKNGPAFRVHFAGQGINKYMSITFGTTITGQSKILSKSSKLEAE